MAPLIDPEQLIGASEIAPMIGLTNSRGVAVYRQRHDDFPRPVVDRAGCVLWLRSAIEPWAKQHSRSGRIQTWWANLTDDQRLEAAAVDGYPESVVPEWFIPSLTSVGVTVPLAQWQGQRSMVMVPDDVTAFIAAQREASE